MESKSFDFKEKKKMMKDAQEGFDMLKKRKKELHGVFVKFRQEI